MQLKHEMFLVVTLLLNAVAPAIISDESDARAVIAKFKEKDPDLAKVFADAHGYAVFPTVGKGGIGIGGARGKGYVYQKGRLIGRSTLTQVTIGLQLGGQAYSEVVFLKDAAAMEGRRRPRLSGWSRHCNDGQGRPHVRGFGRRPEVLLYPPGQIGQGANLGIIIAIPADQPAVPARGPS